MPMMGQRRGGPSLSQLVAPNRPLAPPRPQGQVVGGQRALPSLIPFGPQPQGLVQSSRFTGASAPGGGLSLTHPEVQTPTFHEPQFSMPSQALGPAPPPAPPHPLASILALAALTGAIGGGGGGARPPTPPLPPPGAPQLAPRGGFNQPSSPAGAPGSSGGYNVPAPPAQTAILAGAANNPNPQFQPYNGLAALLANPAVGRRGVFKV